MQDTSATFLGSATVVTRPSFTGTVPTQATPDSIASTAESFVGQAWNLDGCWVLASTIAAEAGAALPVQSTLIGLPGKSNGEWFAVFNGPSGQTGNWQQMVKAGEMVVIGTQGGGHITTCVSGAGSTAMLVDNITYVNSLGQIVNPANDGSANDVLVAAPHLASQEWAGVAASSVVIYELDTPVVTAGVTSDSLHVLASQSLSALFAATDPEGKAITAWQVYDTAASDDLVLNGMDDSDHTAATALQTTSLNGLSLLAGSTATTDTLEVRAYNGSYWGDWTSLAVAITATAPAAPTPPVLAELTAAQTWKGGTAIALVLPAGTFIDPQSQKLTYTATLASGAALPNWLTFNAATDSFTGTAPTSAQSLGIKVTATDISGLSVSDTFAATVIGVPVVTGATAAQTWTEGKAFSLTLASNTFTDPQGEALTYAATLANNAALPSWLTFNPGTETFTGTAPATAQNLTINVTATDTSGLSVSETIDATVKAAATAPHPGITLTAQTPNQVWTDGTTVNLALPANTFTDALGLKMTFVGYEVSGPDVSSWLHFKSATDDLFGVVPAHATGAATLEIIATDSQHVSATDLFSVTFGPAAGHAGASAFAFTPSALAEPHVMLFHA